MILRRGMGEEDEEVEQAEGKKIIVEEKEQKTGKETERRDEKNRPPAEPAAFMGFESCPTLIYNLLHQSSFFFSSPSSSYISLLLLLFIFSQSQAKKI